MRFVKQSIHIPIANIDERTCASQIKINRHSELLPNNLRCIIAGNK